MNAFLFQVIFYYFRTFSKCKVSALYPLCQAILESGSWTSPVYKNANNMLGMTVPSTRDHVGSGKYGKYLAYLTPIDSIRDYFYWLEYWNLTDDNKLQAFLQKSYAEDPAYWQKLQRIRQTVTPQLISPDLVGDVIGGMGVLAVLAVINQTKHAR